VVIIYLPWCKIIGQFFAVFPIVSLLVLQLPPGGGVAAPLLRAVFFFDLSPIVLRLFFVFKTEYNRRTNEEQTAFK